jgi:ribosome-associated protein
MKTNDYRKFAQEAARAASDKKASDIMLFDIRQESDVADYMLIVGADSSAQMRAIEDSVEERLREWGTLPVHRDGHARDRWLALDYGGFVMHILLPDAREFYRLEQMWEHPKVVLWEAPAKPRPTKTRKKERKAS